MLLVVFVTPWLSDDGQRALRAAARMPEVRLVLISQEAESVVPRDIRKGLTMFQRMTDVCDGRGLARVIRRLTGHLGRVDRLLSDSEAAQMALAQARVLLGIAGMRPRVARNFRDKITMKRQLRAAGLPCAQHALVRTDADAWRFAATAGYPVIIKPRAGFNSRHTFRADDARQLRTVLRKVAPQPGREMLMEECIIGDEYSCDSISISGKATWHSFTRYIPTPLEANRDPSCQWCEVLPRTRVGAEFGVMEEVAAKALRALGMTTGITHMEWFRRADGSIVISEIAARPPGAQIPSLISFGHDIDFMGVWTQLMIAGRCDPIPPRRFAVGIVFLRGLGFGKVKEVRGIRLALRELGTLVVRKELPWIGQPLSRDYEGDGFLIVRHRKTGNVVKALGRIMDLVRVKRYRSPPSKGKKP